MSALIIHGHFYQPPREDPWTGKIERQPSAAPYHDWNERIHDECYGPNAFAHIIGTDDVIERTVNNYSNISFNFGPTLLSWLEVHHPITYERILQADRESAARLDGHGNAIAQAYGHAILPLCNDRDRLTQVLWGLADFRYRFAREPESMWLPETACDSATLEVLIKQGLRYVILSPEQAASFRPLHGETWTHLHGNGIDPTRPYLYVGRDGGSITIFFYDGLVARGIAFERALTSSQFLVAMFRSVAQFGPLVNVATDGETYGHHFKFGDLCLAHALEIEAKEAELEVTNYGQYLDGHPPEFEVEIKENSSWSCAHGIGRWSIDCGCAGEPGWNQRWRTPLRSALDFLRDEAARQFEVAAANLFTDPWEARNAYIQVVLDQGHSTATFLEQQVTRSLSPSEQARALTLLEIQRNSLLMFTSCGWFFSELSGIETLQIMRYAARVLELQRELGLPSPRAEFLDILAEAQSNIASQGNGADIFLNLVEHHPPNESLLTI